MPAVVSWIGIRFIPKEFREVAPVLLILIHATSANAVIYGGIDFPAGAVSFADEVVSYDPLFSGGPGPTHPNLINPSVVTGIPDYTGDPTGTGAVSLGLGGRITVKFKDNFLTGSNNPMPDLWIYEIGTLDESANVEISADGMNWHALGFIDRLYGGVDIDSYGFNGASSFSYVRVTDLFGQPTSGSTIGVDIDAIGAISSPQLIIKVDCANLNPLS
jgi:hypothetical protein